MIVELRRGRLGESLSLSSGFIRQTYSAGEVAKNTSVRNFAAGFCDLCVSVVIAETQRGTQKSCMD